MPEYLHETRELWIGILLSPDAPERCPKSILRIGRFLLFRSNATASHTARQWSGLCGSSCGSRTVGPSCPEQTVTRWKGSNSSSASRLRSKRSTGR